MDVPDGLDTWVMTVTENCVCEAGAAEAPEKWSGQSSQSFLKKVYA